MDMNDKDRGQRKWDEAGPEKASGRRGATGGSSYNEGPEGVPEKSLRKKIGEMHPHPDARTPQKGMSESRVDPSGGTNSPTQGKDSDLAITSREPLRTTKDSEWKGGTPDQGPTTGGMGAAGGGHDTDETDVWGKDK